MPINYEMPSVFLPWDNRYKMFIDSEFNYLIVYFNSAAGSSAVGSKESGSRTEPH